MFAALLPILAALGGGLGLLGGGGSGSSGNSASPSLPPDPELQRMIREMLDTENKRVQTQNPLYTAVSKLAMGMLPQSVSPGVGGVPNLFDSLGTTGYKPTTPLPAYPIGVGGGVTPRPVQPGGGGGGRPGPNPDTPPPDDPGPGGHGKLQGPTSFGGQGIDLSQIAKLFGSRYGG
jgi:hypothetical protein